MLVSVSSCLFRPINRERNKKGGQIIHKLFRGLMFFSLLPRQCRPIAYEFHDQFISEHKLTSASYFSNETSSPQEMHLK